MDKEEWLVLRLRFRKFMDGIEYVRKVAEVADRLDHHPDIYISYTKVELRLTTHSAGNKITERDLELGQEIEKIAEEYIRQGRAESINL